MICFEHEDRQAVGLCRACNKGLCAKCAVDHDYGLSCSGDCETEARLVQQQILQNRKSLRTGRQSLYLWPVIFLFMGGSMLVSELLRRGPVLNWATIFGGGLSLFALYMFFINRKWGQVMDASEADE
ncbi:MAG: hypothetical protein L3J67_09610 [Hyphomicrobiaceae bacterium]|nr:hypothetical protein [Hyphomicrobiaceae bacterium]